MTEIVLGCPFNSILFQFPQKNTMVDRVKCFFNVSNVKCLHEVVHRDEQAQGVMGLRHRKLRSAWEILCRFLQNSSVSCKSWFFESFGAFFAIFFEETTFQIVQLKM